MVLALVGPHGVVVLGAAGGRHHTQGVEGPSLALNIHSEVTVRVHTSHNTGLSQGLCGGVIIVIIIFVQQGRQLLGKKEKEKEKSIQKPLTEMVNSAKYDHLKHSQLTL